MGGDAGEVPPRRDGPERGIEMEGGRLAESGFGPGVRRPQPPTNRAVPVNSPAMPLRLPTPPPERLMTWDTSDRRCRRTQFLEDDASRSAGGTTYGIPGIWIFAFELASWRRPRWGISCRMSAAIDAARSIEANAAP